MTCALRGCGFIQPPPPALRFMPCPRFFGHARPIPERLPLDRAKQPLPPHPVRERDKAEHGQRADSREDSDGFECSPGRHQLCPDAEVKSGRGLPGATRLSAPFAGTEGTGDANENVICVGATCWTVDRKG